jgi:hypothetical protein
VNSVTPNSVDLASPPATFSISGEGFRDLGFGLPWVNFTRAGQLIAQTRATALTGTVSLTVPFPTQATSSNVVPGLSAGSVTVTVYNQTGPESFSAIGNTSLTVSNSAPTPVVNAITPSAVNLATAPPTFTVTGAGFRNAGFGLPWVNFMRGAQLIAQARATALTGTVSLTVPFPTQATSPNLVPGLSAGPVSVIVYNQTGQGSYSAIGSTPLTVTDGTAVSAITPSAVNLAAAPATFTVTGAGFRNLGFGLPWVNFVRDGQLIAQARATALTGTGSLTLPFPTQATSPNVVPGLSAGPVTVIVYNQTGPGNFSAVGDTPLTVSDGTSVVAIAPSVVNLAAVPATFTVSGAGFRNLGFGLPWVNFVRDDQLIAQARATALTGTVSLTVPFPTQATSPNVVPGLSAGPVTVIVYNQTGPGSYSALGTTPLTVTGLTSP